MGLCECRCLWESNYCELSCFRSKFYSFESNSVFCYLIIFGLYVFQQDESEIGVAGGNGQLWTLGLGLLATAIAATYVTRLAKVFTILAFCLLPGGY